MARRFTGARRSLRARLCPHGLSDALHQLFGAGQHVMQLAERRTIPANRQFLSEIHVVVCTTRDQHVLNQLTLDRSLFQHYPTDEDPAMLGFQCQGILRDRWGNYDYYCYLEDDLILHDPWLFVKLRWFNGHVGQDKLLLPNRFELGTGMPVHKVYVDGSLRRDVTARFQDVNDCPRMESQVLGTDVVFQRPLNPHSGCWFLSAEQMRHWIRQPFFLARDTSFIGPLESAATLGVMRAFKIYKPAPENASFLEIEHYGNRFLSLLRPSAGPDR